MEELKFMPVEDFRRLGYLQEVNRMFLHPLGLALVVTVDEDGSEELAGIMDARDDPEGVIYGEWDEDSFEKANRIAGYMANASLIRKAILDYVIQPVPVKQENQNGQS